MASTTPLAALYFVALMTFGNYVLFNLLVAILVEGFQAEVRANTQFSMSCSAENRRLIVLCCAVDTKAPYKRIISTILPVWFLLSVSLSVALSSLIYSSPAPPFPFPPLSLVLADMHVRL